MDMSLSKLREIVKDGEAWHAEGHGNAESGHNLRDWTTTMKNWWIGEWMESRLTILRNLKQCLIILQTKPVLWFLNYPIDSWEGDTEPRRISSHVSYLQNLTQAGFRKGRGTRDQIANIRWIMEKAREFQKNIYFCFLDYAKAFDCVDHNKLWKILKEMGIPDHLTCLLRNLYASQEATVRTEHGTTDWFQIGRGRQGCIFSPCLFNLYAEYIMRNTGLEEKDCREKYQ